MTRSAFQLLGCLLLAFCLGCGSKSTTTEDIAVPGPKDALEDLKSLLTDVNNTKQKPPRNQREIQAYDATNPAGVSGVLRLDIIYFYGSGLTGGNAVIAHAAGADTKGGLVLLQDGTIKELTAEEFKAAPKATKK